MLLSAQPGETVLQTGARPRITLANDHLRHALLIYIGGPRINVYQSTTASGDCETLTIGLANRVECGKGACRDNLVRTFQQDKSDSKLGLRLSRSRYALAFRRDNVLDRDQSRRAFNGDVLFRYFVLVDFRIDDQIERRHLVGLVESHQVKIERAEELANRGRGKTAVAVVAPARAVFDRAIGFEQETPVRAILAEQCFAQRTVGFPKTHTGGPLVQYFVRQGSQHQLEIGIHRVDPVAAQSGHVDIALQFAVAAEFLAVIENRHADALDIVFHTQVKSERVAAVKFESGKNDQEIVFVGMRPVELPGHHRAGLGVETAIEQVGIIVAAETDHRDIVAVLDEFRRVGAGLRWRCGDEVAVRTCAGRPASSPARQQDTGQ